MNQKIATSPAAIAGATLAAIALLGSPLISYWLSFFILGNVPFYARLLQGTGHAFWALLPGILLIILAVILGWRALKQGRSSAVRWLAAAGIALASHVLVLWFLLLLVMPRFQIHQIPFDQAKWARVSCQDNTRVRQQMLASLKSQLVGKAKAEATALIGSPDDGQRSYCLGPEAHIVPVDREFLQLVYDREGKVVDFKISGN